MAKVQGVKEKLHSPVYDAFFVKDELKDVTNNVKKTFTDFMTDPRVIRFFVDIQNKTKLETNLQASGVLPSLNTFEARALRVVVSSFRLPCPPAAYYSQATKEKEVKAAVIEAVTEGEIVADLIYNSVTSLIVGEKVMIEMPTYWFPAGAGVSPGFPRVSNHGEPDPTATFRFAEPVFIEPQQNFRVEMSFPHSVPGQGVTLPASTVPDPARLANVQGPLRIWVVLDGYLTRDVQ